MEEVPRLAVILSLCALTAASSTLRAQIPPAIESQMRRLAEEAEIFAHLSQKIIGEESLEQVATEIPRYQPRRPKNGPPPPEPAPKITTRRIVSEYGFTVLKGDPNLHEIRTVQKVDGKTIKSPTKLKDVLAAGAKGDVDKLKKDLLKEFQKHGLKEAALEFGQMLLMFQPRALERFRFQPVRTEFIGADKAIVIAYEQIAGYASFTVFEGKEVMRYAFRGELWLRANDGVPLRITLDTARTQDGNTLRHFGRVDYAMTSYGSLMPVTASYAESITHPNKPPLVFIENRFQYSNYKMFGASSEVKFTAEDAPAEPPPPPTRK